MSARILIADDHPIFRNGVRDILSKVAGFTLVAEAKDGMEAYRTILSSRPDVAILDLEMPQLSGLDVCAKVLSEKSDTRFIILTMHREQHYFLEAMKCGVKGYLLKDHTESDLIDCVKAVLMGETFISEQLVDLKLTSYASNERDPKLVALITGLSATEKVILRLVSDGKTSAEIATLLFSSPHTVENHRANMCRKLDINGKNALLKFALEHRAFI
jgi:DNA-binding NarL/FixJ family response regulator